ncbi:jg17357 [Pararge aegeria aegeria]|uniref:Jg17357 protein n=1 Tax=Pararge aegeria aegeria TaxID=348720 RepID=A0A8S4RSA1_9NEOP|nr:jg17357 [Pararge aegeria aegeria]
MSVAAETDVARNLDVGQEGKKSDKMMSVEGLPFSKFNKMKWKFLTSCLQANSKDLTANESSLSHVAHVVWRRQIRIQLSPPILLPRVWVEGSELLLPSTANSKPYTQLGDSGKTLPLGEAVSRAVCCSGLLMSIDII